MFSGCRRPEGVPGSRRDREGLYRGAVEPPLPEGRQTIGRPDAIWRQQATGPGHVHVVKLDTQHKGVGRQKFLKAKLTSQIIGAKVVV